MGLSAELLIAKNSANPTLSGSIGTSDTTLALTTGTGAKLPTIFSGVTTSLGDGRNLNQTSLANVSVGDFIKNVTDGSWAVVKTVGSNSCTTTPLVGGSVNTWGNAQTWAKNRFVATLVNFDANNNIVKSEQVLVTGHAASADSVTVQRSYNGDAATTFSALDSLMLFVNEIQITQIHTMMRETFVELDNLRQNTDNYATDTGAANAYAITLVPAITSLAELTGRAITFIATHANTTSSTLAVNGLTPTALKKEGGATQLATNDIILNMPVTAVYNGSVFVMENPVAVAPSTGGELMNDKTADFTILVASGAQAYSNNGASGSIALTLPASPTPGTIIDFEVTAAQGLAIILNSGQSFGYPGATTIPTIRSFTQYGSIRLMALTAAIWSVQRVLGAVSFINQSGYACGGSTAAAAASLATIDKLNVAAVTCAAITATLDVARWHIGGCASYWNGYTAGGQGTGGTDIATMAKLVFSADTEANIAATLDNARELSTAGWQNGNIIGYFQGGGASASSSKIDNIDFSADTSVDVVTGLSGAKNQNASVTYANTAGYAMGGGSTGIDKLLFSGVTRSTIAGVLPVSHLGQLPTWSQLAGYACGGNGGGNVTVIKLTYGTEVVSTLGGALVTASEDGNTVSGLTSCFIVEGSVSTTWQIMAYALETWSNSGATLSSARSSVGSLTYC